MTINIGAILKHGLYGASMLIAGALLEHPGAVYAQELAWARSAGGPDADSGWGVAVDAAGNSIVVGTFSDTATFGTATVLTGGGLFLAKYNAEGALIGAARAGSGGDAQAIAVDAAGNSLIGGTFSGTVTFGEESNAVTMNAVSNTDLFLAKYDGNGSLMWVRPAATNEIDPSQGARAVDVAADHTGNVFLAYFSGGSRWTSKYTSDGTLTWNNESSACWRNPRITLDTTENIIVSGACSVGEIPAYRHYPVYLSKYTSSGTSIWDLIAVENPGQVNRGGAVGAGLATDGLGNSLVTGWFSGSGSTYFGSDRSIALVPTPGGGRPGSIRPSDMFISKYGADGHVSWAKQAGGSGQDGGFGVAVDPSNNILVLGAFAGTATFGEGEHTTTLTTTDSSTFLAKYASDGTLIWAKNVGTVGVPQDFSLSDGFSLDVAGNSAFAGNFEGDATIGEGSNNETHLTSAGSSDMFVAKWFDTALSETENLIATIGQYVRQGILNSGQGNALSLILQNAAKSLEKENVNAACGQIGAFVNQADALTKTGQIPQLQGQGLSAAGNGLVGPVLSCH